MAFLEEETSHAKSARGLGGTWVVCLVTWMKKEPFEQWRCGLNPSRGPGAEGTEGMNQDG